MDTLQEYKDQEEMYESSLIIFIWRLIWPLLPDNCEETNCPGKGVRGNENIVNGKVLCDHCSSVANGFTK